jgi:hypothetical protein
MQKQPKITHIVKSLKNSPNLWQEKLYKYWQLGNQASLGFAIGDTDDSPAKALAKEGYELIVEMKDFAIGTDSLTSIIVVANCYGPWAVDVTDNLLTTNAKEFSSTALSFETYKTKSSAKNILKPQS